MYESADQKEPVYEAKGIETVRRDGCPLVAKVSHAVEDITNCETHTRKAPQTNKSQTFVINILRRILNA